MSLQPYPQGIDCVWLALDVQDHVGAFITAGIGPIPAEALRSVNLPVEGIEGRICQLPSVSQVLLLFSVKRPDDFIDLAKRGVFVYDWTDIHRTAGKELRMYEPVAIPAKPITACSLPADLAALAKTLRLSEVIFAETQPVDVRAYLNCAEAE